MGTFSSSGTFSSVHVRVSCCMKPTHTNLFSTFNFMNLDILFYGFAVQKHSLFSFQTASPSSYISCSSSSVITRIIYSTSQTFFQIVATLLTASMPYDTASMASLLFSAETATITLACPTGTKLQERSDSDFRI